MIQRRALFLVCFVLAGFCSQTLNSFQLFVQNSLDDIVLSKRILVRIELEKTDQYLYKDSLRFSIDVPGIELKSWHASIHPTMQYSLLFKRNKLIYPESFTAEIVFTLGHELSDPLQIPEKIVNRLRDANMYVAGLVYGKDGKNSAQTAMVSCYKKDDKKNGDHSVLAHNNLIAQDNLERHQDHDYFDDTLNQETIEQLGSELLFFNELLVVWKKITQPVKQFIGSKSFSIWYMILLVLWVLFLIKRYFRWMRFVIPFRGVWEKEIRRFLGFLVIGASFYWASLLIDLYVILYSFACFLFICSCYYLKQTPNSTTFLGKLKIIIGFFCAFLVLPVFLKAFFLQKYLLFC